MEEKKYNLDQDLCFQLYVASKEIVRAYQPYLAELGLTYTSFIALRAMENGMSVRRLGKQLFLDSGTLSPLLKKMEVNGLLTRTRDRADERVLVIELTSKGTEMQEKLPTVSKQVFNKITTRNPNIPFELLLENLQEFNLVFK